MRVELGIIGTGRIAGRFVEMVHRYFPEQVSVAGVYNPNRESAEAFAKKNAITFFSDEIGDFLEKMSRRNTESSEKTAKTVYVASPHQTHYNYAKCALEAGFHVLCEKPMTLKRVQTEELFAIARTNGLVLMEGIKTAFCPGYKKLVEVAKSGVIGDILDVEAAFTRIGPTDSREYWDEKFGGSFLEFGRYPMLPIYDLLAAFHEKHAMEVSFHSIASDTAMDKYTKAVMSWKDADGLETCLATIKTGLGVKSEGELLISGTTGYIQVPSPWWLTKKFVVRFENPNKTMEYNFEYADSGLQYEMQEFLDRIEMKVSGLQGPDGKQELEDAAQSVWCTNIFEKFRDYYFDLKKLQGYQDRRQASSSHEGKKSIGIWAHRGCSMEYPENTLTSFREAAKLDGIRGIEFDVQYTKDRQLVVFHDETLDRVTNGKGFLRNFTLEELKQLDVWSEEKIPTLAEVFVLLKPYCLEKGLLLNIELKTSVYRYEGIEKMTADLVREYGLENYIVYSSFLPDSIVKIKEIVPEAKTGILARDMSECLRINNKIQCDALHPSSAGIDCSVYSGDVPSVTRSVPLSHETKVLFSQGNEECSQAEGTFSRPEGTTLEPNLWAGTFLPVRMWNGSEPLYGSGKPWKEKDLLRFERFGITDIITNVPEYYIACQRKM
ncbi:MAG: glycerophosphodiester phosphodiesterase family protein [Lachnospiraceae bacterium]